MAEQASYSAATAKAAVAVLKELKLHDRASAGCIAQLATIIAEETRAPDMLTTLLAFEAADQEEDSTEYSHLINRANELLRALLLTVRLT